MAIRAVIFDFGGVLCFHPSDEKIARFSEKCGLPVAQFLEAFWNNRLEYDAGRLTPTEYWQGVAESAGIHIGPADLPPLVRLEIELWNHYDQRVFAWIEQLRAANLRIGLLSNLPKPLGEELRATRGFLDPFDHVTYSYELKLVKPQLEIYQHSVAGLRVNPQEALFLDDRRVNVAGALEAGLQAEKYSSWEDFLASGAIERWGLPRPE